MYCIKFKLFYIIVRIYKSISVAFQTMLTVNEKACHLVNACCIQSMYYYDPYNDTEIDSIRSRKSQ